MWVWALVFTPQLLPSLLASVSVSSAGGEECHRPASYCVRPAPAWLWRIPVSMRRQNRGEKGILKTLAYVAACFLVADLATE